MLHVFTAALLLNLLLIAPLWWHFGGPGAPLVALEAWAIVPLLMLVPTGWFRRWLTVLLVAWAGLVSMANLGDAATHTAFGRSLNLYLDVPLIRSVYHLLAGNAGEFAAVVLMTLGGLVILGALLSMSALLSPRRTLSVKRLSGAAALALGLAALTLALFQSQGTRLLPGAVLPMVDTTAFQLEQVAATHRARQDFEAALEEAPIEARALPGLAERDVLLTFIESYGVTALEQPRYAELIGQTLRDMGERLAARDLEVVSGLLRAPIRGGQSWLAHASVLSGRWIDNPLWYRLMLESGHSNLVGDFHATGQRSLTVMPAITLAWPEGIAYGFEEIRTARNIPYRGPPLNWVTMPDQFTLDYVARQQLDGSPLFAQIALISSHAPWTPILPVLENWSMIGDGSLFAPWENAADPPEVIWQDLERIREHYGWSVNYALASTARFAERVVDDRTLLIVLGDHQPAPLITGDDASAAVPVHIVSGDSTLLDAFRARGFTDGPMPPLDHPERAPRMSELRHWLQEDFGSGNGRGERASRGGSP